MRDGIDARLKHVFVASGQSVSRDIEPAGSVLHCKAVTKKFAHPSVLPVVPERHDQELEMPVVRAERRLVHVVRVHGDLVIATARSSLVKNTAPLSSSRSSSTIGMGKRSCTVRALSAL